MKTAFFIALALAALPLPAAQLYKWVDEKGNVEWRDTPPPPNAKNVETRVISGNTADASSVPFSVQQAVKKNPITLWTFPDCAPCNDGRAHLVRRQLPYTERNAQRDMEGLKKLTGGNEAPILLVGTKQVKGYLASDWDAALDEAGYPRTVPPGYKPQVKTDPVKDDAKKDDGKKDTVAKDATSKK